MHAILIPIGSHGDVHPFAGLAQVLRGRGHRVTLITNPHFEPLIRRLGFDDFAPLGTEELFHQVINNPDLWNGIHGFRTVTRYTTGAIPALYEAIRERYVESESVVVAPVTAYAARIGQEAHGWRYASVNLQPCILRSAIDPAELPGIGLARALPVWGRRMLFALLDRLLVDPMMARPINAFRASIGLKRRAAHMMDWWNSSQCIINLFPAWFAPPPPDWPSQAVTLDFPLYDEQDLHELPPDLVAFLGAGDPPIAFTAGSAMRHGHHFFAAAVEACSRLNRRGLLITRFADQLPSNLPESVRHVAYAPFSDLLPRCAALVHHGGIGTTAQTLAAGIPHVVTPMAHDQPDNASRLERLGVARRLAPRNVTGPHLAAELGALLSSREVAERCSALAARLVQHDALERACDVLEAFQTSGTVSAH